jgi:hypothetical protein
MRQSYQTAYEDITAGDFRHLIDHITSYSSTATPECGPDPEDRVPRSVRGVKISCFGEKSLHGAESFMSVWVHSFHPAMLDQMSNNGRTSPISQILGVPIRLWKYPDNENWINIPGWNHTLSADSNQNAAFLMVETDVNSPDWGWVPLTWNLELGNVLAVREDGQDLDLNYLRFLCRFVREKLQPMIEDALGSGTSSRTKREVRDFMTTGNFENFMEETMKEERGSF